jgi:hypothetical protein
VVSASEHMPYERRSFAYSVQPSRQEDTIHAGDSVTRCAARAGHSGSNVGISTLLSISFSKRSHDTSYQEPVVKQLTKSARARTNKRRRMKEMKEAAEAGAQAESED